MDYDKIRQNLEDCRREVRLCESEIDHINSQAIDLAREMDVRTRKYLEDTFRFLDEQRIGYLFDVGEDSIDMDFPAGVVVSYDIVDVSPVNGSEHLISGRQRAMIEGVSGDYVDWMSDQVDIIDSLQADSMDFLKKILEGTFIETPFDAEYLDYSLIFLAVPTQEFYLSCGMDMVKGLYGPLGTTDINRNDRLEDISGMRSSTEGSDVLVCYNPSIIVTADDVQQHICRFWQEIYDQVHSDVAERRLAPAGPAKPSRDYPKDIAARLMFN